jgi:hypothetical protein
VPSTGILEDERLDESARIARGPRIRGRLETDTALQSVAPGEIDMSPSTCERLGKGQDLMMRERDSRLTPFISGMAWLGGLVPLDRRRPKRTHRLWRVHC